MGRSLDLEGFGTETTIVTAFEARTASRCRFGTTSESGLEYDSGALIDQRVRQPSA